ncbi:MAG: PQQ-binding-like beta-propeller repeat protein [Sedimentisphaerales bacterium]|nr:PQQ-binding-like beta-propeller repeat protein [Sedimentisphaerales bacterium]
MVEVFRRWFLILFAVLLFWPGLPFGFAEADNSLRPVSPKLLEHAKLRMLWYDKVPIKKSESLDELFIVGERVYALSDHNYLVCYNRVNGRLIFSKSIAPAGLPVLGLELYRDKLHSIIGNRLVELNPEFGTELSSKHLEFDVICPAACNSSFFYLSGRDRSLHALRAEDKVPIFQASANDGSQIISVIADVNLVVFATDTGACISMAVDEQEEIWRFSAAGAIVHPIVRDGDELYIASKDTNIYKLNIHTGNLIWTHQTAGFLDTGPQSTKNTIYQHVPREGLLAVDKASGKRLWTLAGGEDLLAERNRLAYVITDGRKLVVMDNKAGRELYSVNFVGVSRYVSNVGDEKIYIADEAGRIACLAPIE